MFLFVEFDSDSDLDAELLNDLDETDHPNTKKRKVDF